MGWEGADKAKHDHSHETQFCKNLQILFAVDGGGQLGMAFNVFGF